MFALRIQTDRGDINLHFKTEEAARRAADKAHVDCDVTDDYGRRARFNSIAWSLLQDLDQEVECSVDLAMLQQRAQRKAQSKAGAITAVQGAVATQMTGPIRKQ